MPPIASRFACATTLIVVACTSRTNPSPAPSSAAGGTTAAITTTDLERRLFTIAHDSMMGRETGSEGAFKTTTYIAAEFQRLGLRPAGDNGTYFQVVPFWRLAFRRDFLPSSAVTMRDVDLETIYAGPVNDPERLITADQARGKFVIVDL